MSFARDNYPIIGVKTPLNWHVVDPTMIKVIDTLPCVAVENFSTYEENIFLGDLVGRDGQNRDVHSGISHVTLRFLAVGRNNLERSWLLGLVSRLMSRKNLKALGQYGILDVRATWGAPYPVDTDFLLSYSITAQKQDTFASVLAYEVKVIHTDDSYDDHEDYGYSFIQEVRMTESCGHTDDIITSVGLSADDLYIQAKLLLHDIGAYL